MVNLGKYSLGVVSLGMASLGLSHNKTTHGGHSYIVTEGIGAWIIEDTFIIA